MGQMKDRLRGAENWARQANAREDHLRAELATVCQKFIQADVARRTAVQECGMYKGALEELWAGVEGAMELDPEVKHKLGEILTELKRLKALDGEKDAVEHDRQHAD